MIIGEPKPGASDVFQSQIQKASTEEIARGLSPKYRSSEYSKQRQNLSSELTKRLGLASVAGVKEASIFIEAAKSLGGKEGFGVAKLLGQKTNGNTEINTEITNIEKEIVVDELWLSFLEKLPEKGFQRNPSPRYVDKDKKKSSALTTEALRPGGHRIRITVNTVGNKTYALYETSEVITSMPNAKMTMDMENFNEIYDLLNGMHKDIVPIFRDARGQVFLDRQKLPKLPDDPNQPPNHPSFLAAAIGLPIPGSGKEAELYSYIYDWNEYYKEYRRRQDSKNETYYQPQSLKHQTKSS